MKLVVINKRPYAVGLLWFTPDEVGKTGGGKGPGKKTLTLRKYAAIEAMRQDSDFDLVAFRNKQFGLGDGGDEPAWSKARSLAAALKTPSSFLGLFQLEDVFGHATWWVYACKAGVLSEQADVFFDEYDAAKTYINQSLVGLLGEFDDAVECSSHAASQAWLAPLLGVSPLAALFGYDSSRLTPVQYSPEHRQKLVVIAGLFAALGLGLYVVSAFFEHRAAQQAIEAARLATLNKERRFAELMENPDQVFPPLWATAARADVLASACIKSLFAQPTAVSGWELTGAVCTASGKGALRLTWEHRPGADFLHLPPTAKMVGTNKAVMGLPLSVPHIARTDSDFRTLFPREIATRAVYQLTQQLGSRLRFDLAPPAKSIVDGIELSAPWQRGAWELSDVPDAAVLDGSLFFSLARLPGLVVESIAFDGTWTLKGALYVQK